MTYSTHSWIELLNVKNLFDMKLKSYKEKETLKERGTKRFQERLAEEKEAEKEIKNYKSPEKDECLANTDRPAFP